MGKSHQTWIIIAALLGSLGVVLGAYAAHGLEKYLVRFDYTPDELTHHLENLLTGVRYQMIHALAILLVGGILYREKNSLFYRLASFLFLGGTLLFSGSLYVITLGGPAFYSLGQYVVPLGGILLIIAWQFVAAGAWQAGQEQTSSEQTGPKQASPE